MNQELIKEIKILKERNQFLVDELNETKEQLNKYLYKYKGWKYNTMAINTIQHDFHPYKVILCDENDYNNDVYLHKTIRCVAFEGIIADLKFN